MQKPYNKKRFLVLSYDDDQQQWFYDFVLAQDAPKAQEFIEDNRADAIAAVAIGLKVGQLLFHQLEICSEKSIREAMKEIRKNNEDLFLQTTNEPFKCASCGHQSNHDDLPNAKDLLQRIEPGEIFTDVECPECGALCFPVGP